MTCRAAIRGGARQRGDAPRDPWWLQVPVSPYVPRPRPAAPRRVVGHIEDTLAVEAEVTPCWSGRGWRCYLVATDGTVWGTDARGRCRAPCRRGPSRHRAHGRPHATGER